MYCRIKMKCTKILSVTVTPIYQYLILLITTYKFRVEPMGMGHCAGCYLFILQLSFLFILRLSYLFFRWLCILPQDSSLSLHHHRICTPVWSSGAIFIMSTSRSKLYRCNVRACSVFLLFFFSAFFNVFLFTARGTIIIAGRTIIIMGRTIIIAGRTSIIVRRTSFSTNFLPLSLLLLSLSN